MPLSWYPRNFTNPDLNYLDQNVRISDDALYNVQLGLYVIGYKEFKDDQVSLSVAVIYMLRMLFQFLTI